MRNTVYNEIMAAIQISDAGEITARLAARKISRRRHKAVWRKIRAAASALTLAAAVISGSAQAQGIMDRHIAAVAANDIPAALALYADDATIWNGGLCPCVGKASIRRELERRAAAPAQVSIADRFSGPGIDAVLLRSAGRTRLLVYQTRAGKITSVTFFDEAPPP